MPAVAKCESEKEKLLPKDIRNITIVMFLITNRLLL